MYELEITDDTLKRTKTLQIIVAALVFGVVNFAGIALFLNLVIFEKPLLEDPQVAQLLSVVLMGVALSAMVAQWFVVALIVKSGRKAIAQTTDPLVAIERLYELLFTRTILGAAFCEAAAFTALVGFLLTKDWTTFIVVAIALVLLAFRFPTVSGVQNWLQSQLRIIEEEKQWSSYHS